MMPLLVRVDNLEKQTSAQYAFTKSPVRIGRNRLHGFVEEVRVDGLLAQVRLRIGDQTLTAVITSDAVRELRLRRGEDAIGIVKSTEVMIGREVTSLRPSSRRR